jgi:ABC-type proline/glycine betaine transport system substrate-binding protein
MLQANVAEKILKGIGLGDSYKTQSSIMPTFAVTTAITTKTIGGMNISLQDITGNLWISLVGDAGVTALTGYKATAGTVIEAYVAANVTMISDVTGATAQIMIWGN